MMNWIQFTGDGEEPLRQHPGDAGFDLFVSDTVVVKPRQFIDAPCDISIQMPTGMWAMITGRSSTLRRRGLLVVQGIIDCGYRGPIYTGVQNLGDEEVWIQEGERLAQLIPFRLEPVRFKRVDALRASDRGEKGFGSTGA